MNSGGVHFNVQHYLENNWQCYGDANRPTLEACAADVTKLLGDGRKVRTVKTTWLYKFEIVESQPMLPLLANIED